MLSLVIFFLTAVGVIYVVTSSVIFAPIRVVIASWGPFFTAGIYCPKCVGFWVGLVLEVALAVDPWSWATLRVAFFSGALVMGAVELARAVWPDFLESAWEREQQLVQERQR